MAEAVFPPSNPYSTFFRLKIGGKEFKLVPPKHFESMTHVRVGGDSANKLTLELVDTTAVRVEQAILTADKASVEYQYGYVDGAESPTFSGTIMNYVPHFTPNAVKLTVEITSMGALSLYRPRIKCFTPSEFEGNPGKIVKWIIENQEKEFWEVGEVRETKKVPSSDKNQKWKQYEQKNITSASFISQELCPDAVSDDSKKMGGYKLFFDDKGSSGGKSKVYFVPRDFQEPRQGVREVSMNVGRSKSNVLSWDPDIQGNVMAMWGGGTVVAMSLDPVTLELINAKQDGFTQSGRPSTGTKTMQDYKVSITMLGGSVMNKTEMENWAANLWFNAANQAFKGALQILGDPLIAVHDKVKLMVQTFDDEFNNTQPRLHYTSGVYLVLGITDSISGGTFTSTLQLIRNALETGRNSSGGTNINSIR